MTTPLEKTKTPLLVEGDVPEILHLWCYCQDGKELGTAFCGKQQEHLKISTTKGVKCVLCEELEFAPCSICGRGCYD